MSAIIHLTLSDTAVTTAKGLVLTALLFSKWASVAAYGFVMFYWYGLLATSLTVADVVADAVEQWVLPLAGIPPAAPDAFPAMWCYALPPLLALFALDEGYAWWWDIVVWQVMELWIGRLVLWPRLLEPGSGWRSYLFALTTASVACAACVLQWAYYATLPLAVGAEADSTVAAELWHLLIVMSVDRAARCASVVVDIVLRAGGFSLLARVLRGAGLVTSQWLDDSPLDPSTQFHQLSNGLVVACMVAMAAWIYCPEWMPFFSWMHVVAAYLRVLLARQGLTEFHRILRPFPAVTLPSTDTCPICLDAFGPQRPARQLPCGHYFHGPCLRQWLMDHNACPNCRRPVQPHAPAAATPPEPAGGALLPERPPPVPAALPRRDLQLQTQPPRPPQTARPAPRQPVFTGMRDPLVRRRRRPEPESELPSPQPQPPNEASALEQALRDRTESRKRLEQSLFEDAPLTAYGSGSGLHETGNSSRRRSREWEAADAEASSAATPAQDVEPDTVEPLRHRRRRA